ncbi:putative bifunctional diguanylate cyclase/phosphodiesterase [Fodinicola acaciae]|uniref:putative bifunctional diguanylate cyclase/phosphodiesterase n=1 Tax=Fodinicola acaciae TaxID=2681555 RepID=UPI0013CFFAE4|nr:bifunctional diguanylate cyclase/phosphodiesterase [Fodinicola acaciae]
MTTGESSARRWRPTALTAFVGGVLLLGVAANAVVFGEFVTRGVDFATFGRVAVATGLLFLAFRWRVQVRLRSQSRSYFWGEAAILIAIVLAPTPLVVTATTVGVTLALLTLGSDPIKVAFSSGQNALTSFAAWSVFRLSVGDAPVLSVRGLVALFVAGVAFVVVSEILFAVVIRLAQPGVSVRLLGKSWCIDQLVSLSNVSVGTAVAALTAVQPVSAVLLPAVIGVIRWMYASSVRLRQHEEAFKRLEEVTHELNQLDEHSVLEALVAGAAQLFRAEAVEVVMANGTVVSGTGRGADEAPEPDTLPAIQFRPLQAAGQHLGELRLRFASQVRLTDAEERTFSTLAAVAGVSIGNARQHEQTRRDAILDPLTELPNRRALMVAINLALAERPESVSLLLVDLDRFKDVNDTLGHAAGDRLLQEVGERLTGAVGTEGQVYRLGGDEFAILVPSATPRQLVTIADRMVQRLAVPVRLDIGMASPVAVTVVGSIGVAKAVPTEADGYAELPTELVDATELLRRADVAMYRAKGAGGGIDHYDPNSDPTSLQRLLLEPELRAALEDPEQIVVEFQPQLDATTGEPVGAEALVRWHHPVYGVLNADVVVPAVARAGLDTPLTMTVLERALRARNEWFDKHGVDVRVAVNLAPRSVLDRQLPDQIARLLRRHRTPADKLVLELPETVATTDLDAVATVLTALHTLGVQISLDDFGTGGAPLTMLARLPVDEVKIDRSFVTEMNRSATSEAIVRATVDLAHSLRLRTVGVGVGNATLDRSLRELGCDAVQGHFYSGPVDAGRAGALLAEADKAAQRRQAADVVRLASVRRRQRPL